MVKFVQNPQSNPRLNLQICRGRGIATQFFTEAEVNRGIILLAEAEEKSSFLGKTEAEYSVDHWTVI